MTVSRAALTLVATAVALSVYACEKSTPTEVAPPLPVEASSATAAATGIDQSPKGGVLIRKSSSAGDGGATTSTRGPLTPHSGLILDHTNTYAIFWDPAWTTNPQFTGDKITSLQSFFAGFGGSNYSNTLTEYGATTQSTFKMTIMDNSQAPNFDPGPSILGGHICALLDAHGLAPDYYAFYAIYTPARYTVDPNGFLGYHAKATCHNVTIHEALIYTADSVSPADHSFVVDGIHHSNNAAELVNVTAHELAETITNPDLTNGWYAVNSKGEVADKCNFTFNTSAPFLTLHNGGIFKLQGEWSNFAFNHGTGAPNGNNPPENGCVFSSAPWVHATISGPVTLSQYQQVTYTANMSGGTPPYQYYWLITAYPSLTFGYSNNTSQTFVVELYSHAAPMTPFTVQLLVSDALGHSISPYPVLNGTAYP